MPLDHLFPSVMPVEDVIVLTGDTPLDDSMLGCLLRLAGHTLAVSSLGLSGVVWIVGPGALSGDVVKSLDTNESLAITVTEDGTAWAQSMPPQDVLDSKQNARPELTKYGVHGSAVASASTVNLDAATGDLVDITGTTGISAFTLAEGSVRTVKFGAALMLTHGSDLGLPNNVDLAVGAGDFAILRGYAGGVVRCVLYFPAAGYPLRSDVTALSGQVSTLSGNVTTLTGQVAGKAPLSSPALTDVPTTPTAAPGTSTSQIASTEFVMLLAALLAPLANAHLTGAPTAPTATAGNNSTQIATTQFVAVAVAALVASAPGTLDTLKELADALGDDPNFATTMTNLIATKAPIYSPVLTGLPRSVSPQPQDFTTGIATSEYTVNVINLLKGWTQATGTITVSVGVTYGQYVDINGSRYSYSTPVDGQQFFTSAATLAAVINGGYSTVPANTDVFAVQTSSTVVTLYARTVGASGNGLTLAVSGAQMAVSGSTLTSGTTVGTSRDNLLKLSNAIDAIVSLVGFASSYNSAAPNAAQPVSAIVASGAGTDIAAALVPKGTGAIQAQIPDATAAAGNVRGAYATDLQRNRGAATAVASGTSSVILGGGSNTASNTYSIVIGGASNTASGSSAIVVGGSTNTASGNVSFIGGGSNNLADGIYSVIVGGQQATTRGNYGAQAFSAGQFATPGDAQTRTLCLRMATTNNTQTEMSMDGAAASNTTRMVLPNNTSFGYVAYVAYKNPATGACSVVRIEGVVTRVASAGATSITTPTYTWLGVASALNSCDVVVLAYTTNGALVIKVTGLSATTLHWFARVETFEIG